MSVSDPNGRGSPIDLAQCTGSKSGLCFLWGWLMQSSPSPPSRAALANEDRSGEGDVGTVILTFAFHSGLFHSGLYERLTSMRAFTLSLSGLACIVALMLVATSPAKSQPSALALGQTSAGGV